MGTIARSSEAMRVLARWPPITALTRVGVVLREDRGRSVLTGHRSSAPAVRPVGTPYPVETSEVNE